MSPCRKLHKVLNGGGGVVHEQLVRVWKRGVSATEFCSNHASNHRTPHSHKIEILIHN